MGRAIKLLILILGLTVAIGCGNSSSEKYMNHSKSNAFTDGTSYMGMWLDGKLEYIVFAPRMVDSKAQSSQWPDSMEPASDGLTLIPEGLYNDGKRITTSEVEKVFILNKDSELILVNIDPEQFMHFNLSNIEELDNSPAWPLLKNEIINATTTTESNPIVD